MFFEKDFQVRIGTSDDTITKNNKVECVVYSVTDTLIRCETTEFPFEDDWRALDVGREMYQHVESPLESEATIDWTVNVVINKVKFVHACQKNLRNETAYAESVNAVNGNAENENATVSTVDDDELESPLRPTVAIPERWRGRGNCTLSTSWLSTPEMVDIWPRSGFYGDLVRLVMMGDLTAGLVPTISNYSANAFLEPE